MEEFRETELNGVKLRVYRDGTIWTYGYTSSRGKIMEWRNQLLNQKSSYYRVCLQNKMYLIHRIIGMVYLGLDINDVTKYIDHIDRCKTNNNVNNLRIVTPRENNFNNNGKGYHWSKSNKKWCAQIKINKKTKHIGYFDNEEDARNAYLEAKAKYHVINHHPHPQEI
jgi:hypothetical protein